MIFVGMDTRISLKVIATVIVAISTLRECRSCYISDCAMGGKRAGGSLVEASNHALRQCIPCGPNNSGQCVGPRICCGSFGCYFGTQESTVCEQENQIPVPCDAKGQSCGEFGHGRCVAANTCCSGNNCTFDKSCKTYAEDNVGRKDSSTMTFKRAFKDLLEDRLFSAMNARRR
ncbi:oxytocin-neurophysin 1-like [Ptychodera flava]|uniref:oxytocin-neurophysin 1-like n=1 Tax=Ptychodera flava TaxID=63121 RepID=UPI00396A8597